MMMPSRTWFQKWFQDWWFGQLLSALLSCVLCAALCILLRKYNEEPVPSFGTPFTSRITLNALVSLLVSLSVAMALSAVQECISQLKWLWYSDKSRPLRDIETYDGAGRGGLFGSIELLWKLRFTPIASLGALLVISHLAIAPLTQQGVLSISHSVNSGTATVNISKAWYEPSGQPQTGSMPGTFFNSLGLSMKWAIMRGLFTDVNIELDNTKPACISGNCTFPPYESLAVCAWTADVTSHLKQAIAGEYNATKHCLPGGYCLNYAINNDTIANISSATPFFDENTSQSLNYTSIAFSDHISPIADVYIIFRNDTQTARSEGDSVSAIEFILDWCIPTFWTNVTVGTDITSWALNASTTLQHDEPTGSVTGMVKNESYQIDAQTHYTLQFYMALTLSGNITQIRDEGVFLPSSDTALLLSSAAGATVNRNNLIAGDATQISNGTINDSLDHLDRILANTATSMTNYIRSRPDVAGGWNYASGTVWAQQIIVEVRWAWFTAPIAFSAISLFFFIVVAALGRHRQTLPPKWKSSSIAMLHSLDPQLHSALGAMTLRSTMDDRVKDLNVRLAQEGDGWRLVEAAAKEYVALKDQENEAGTSSKAVPIK